MDLRYSAAGLCGRVGVAALLAGFAGLAPAFAQTKLEAHYRATLAGMAVGTGSWIVDVGDDHYAMAASGQTTGMLRLFASGNGTAAVRGTISGQRLAPNSYALNIQARRNVDEVRIGLASGVVKSLSVEPPPKPSDDRVPLTDAHKRGVTDPMSAGLLPRASAENLSPEICRRTVAVFDGRQRYDLALSYKRTDRVKAEKGYEGQAIVCAVRYVPVSGHDPNRFGTKFLRDATDIEIAYAPVAGTRFAAMFRIQVPTTMGPAVLEATRFIVPGRTPREPAPRT